MNTTNITSEILEKTYYTQSIPLSIITSISLLSIFFILGMIFVKKSKSKFMLIWVISLTFSIFGLIFLYLFPNFMQNLLNLFR